MLFFFLTSFCCTIVKWCWAISTIKSAAGWGKEGKLLSSIAICHCGKLQNIINITISSCAGELTWKCLCSISPLDCPGAYQSFHWTLKLTAWAGRNKSFHLLVFHLRHRECFMEGLHMCYAPAEQQSCGDWCLCIHFAGCHSNTVHFHQSFLRTGFALRWKHFRSSKYHYEINLLSKWWDSFFCVICALLKPVKEQKEKRNHSWTFTPIGGERI